MSPTVPGLARGGLGLEGSCKIDFPSKVSEHRRHCMGATGHIRRSKETQVTYGVRDITDLELGVHQRAR